MILNLSAMRCRRLGLSVPHEAMSSHLAPRVEQNCSRLGHGTNRIWAKATANCSGAFGVAYAASRLNLRCAGVLGKAVAE